MFRYSFLIDSLLKAMGHKYIRRVPKGVTKTGATKYMYYYAGQEGHGKGVAHESELVTGASFAFGEHGKTRYHAHITKVDGDKLTIKYDDGDKKGTEETMTKKQFQSMIHGEHSTSIQSAKEKATKQLKDFQAGKEKGVKVKQETLDKLEQRVKNLDALTAKKEEAQKPEAPIQMIKDMIKNTINDRVQIKQHDEGASIGMNGFLSVAKQLINKINAPSFKYRPFTIQDDMLDDVLDDDIFHEIMMTDSIFEELERKNKDIIKQKSDEIRHKFGGVGKSNLQTGFYKTIYEKVFTPSFKKNVLKDIFDNLSQDTPRKNLDLFIWRKLRTELQNAFDDEVAKLH